MSTRFSDAPHGATPSVRWTSATTGAWLHGRVEDITPGRYGPDAYLAVSGSSGFTPPLPNAALLSTGLSALRSALTAGTVGRRVFVRFDGWTKPPKAAHAQRVMTIRYDDAAALKPDGLD